MMTIVRKILFPKVSDLDETEAPQKVLTEVQGSIVNQAMLAFLVFAVPTCAAYLVLGERPGWPLEGAVLLAVAMLVTAVGLFRRRASMSSRALVMIGIWFAIGAVGLFAWGLSGSGLLFLVSAGGLTALVFGPWAGVLVIMTSVLLAVMAGAAVRSGALPPSAALGSLIEHSVHWWFHLVAFGLFAAMVVFILGRQSTWMKELILSLGDRSRELSRLNRRLEGEIEERRIAEKAADYQHRCEKLVTEISSHFIHLPSEAVDRNIEVALGQVCRFVGLEAAYLLMVSEEDRTLADANLWQDETNLAPREVLDALTGRSMAWQEDRFKNCAVTAVSTVDQVPAAAGIDAKALEKNAVAAFLEVPMIYRGGGVGLLGLLSGQQRVWSDKEIGLLQMIGQVFTQALERKRAETALRDSEATLRSILRAVPVGIGTLENRRIHGGNQRLFAMLGYSEEELVGESFRRLYPDQDEFDRVGEKIYRRLARDGQAAVETRWRCKNGKVLDILLNTAVVEPAGSADRFTLAALDITERKRAEEALRESERNYREIFNATQEAIFIHEAESGRIMAVNRTVGEMFGYEDSEVRRLTLGDISAQQGAYRESNALEKIRSAVEKGSQVFEWRSRHKNGEVFWTEIALKSTEIGGLGRVLAVVRNIDHRKRAEKALRESEERFRTLVENARAGICIVRDDRILYLNPGQENIFGPQSNVRDIFQFNLHPDDTAKFMQHYLAVRQGRQDRSNLEARFFPGDHFEREERMRWVHCDISVIPYQGAPAILITMVDMTRTKELEKLVHYREKMVSLGHVAAGIAHEIRNPLSGINVLVDGIRENFQDPSSVDDIHRLLSETQKASDKIAAVIKRVLDFSRPSQPQLSLTDINLPIKEALALSESTMRKAGIVLETNLSDSLPPLYLDEQMIEQVVMNLLSNAVEALNKDLSEKRVRISSRNSNGYVIIDIADSGPGVPDALRNKVFDPFYTTRSDGSGIGLSLCQRLIADHGGSISISNSDWGGAEFSIRIPTEKRMTKR